jgi:ABC-type branched-subunit amino acid transport system ATPase component
LLLVLALAGALALALPLYGGFAMTQLGGASTTTAWAAVLGAALASAALLPIGAPHIESVAVAAPDVLLRRLAWCVAVTGLVLMPLGWMPLPAQGVALAIGALTAAMLATAGEALLGAVVPPRLRASAGMLAFGAALAGAMSGPNLMATADRTWGLRVTLLLMGAVVLAAARVVRAIGPRVRPDHARVVEELVEREELVRQRRGGTSIPMLSCRRVSFSYGQLQVLFDVDFAVDEGEMVALLGTNGAGKSTLLKVISGVGLPSSGTVRLRGEDITYAEPAERVRHGITQIPGGKAVFGPLSVADNLRLYGYALGRDRRAVDAGIDESFATFPRLAERRNAPASTLSGGEQQMLALTKAFILRPQVLLIDELSLGLAPKVVGELLTMVRRINASGTAVVLVEQSVNVALSLASHAYFMEKGEIRFDGATRELLDRPDVLRSVFLQGASKGLST